MKAADSFADPLLLVPATRAAQICGKSVRTWRAWQSGGLIPAPVRVGRSLLWRVRDLEAWAAAGCPPREMFFPTT
jgi:predicted DNA-binding transcriptional regulator AlpA